MNATQSKRKDSSNIPIHGEELGRNARKETIRLVKQPYSKKIQEPSVLVECDFIVEVSQSVANNGKHANYISQLIRGVLEQNKHIRDIFDIDAFEPSKEGA